MQSIISNLGATTSPKLPISRLMHTPSLATIVRRERFRDAAPTMLLPASISEPREGLRHGSRQISELDRCASTLIDVLGTAPCISPTIKPRLIPRPRRHRAEHPNADKMVTWTFSRVESRADRHHHIPLSAVGLCGWHVPLLPEQNLRSAPKNLERAPAEKKKARPQKKTNLISNSE